MLSYSDARKIVIEAARKNCGPLLQETVELGHALGRVLARNVTADRDYPPFPRSTRDGFAVRASDISNGTKTLKIIGESRAGVAFFGSVGAGECVQIMTGAAVPAGADAVVMQEHTRPGADEVTVEREINAGQNVVASGSEAKSGAVVVPLGTRLGFAELAMAAQVGATKLEVYRKPRVAILSTGDEVVPVEQTPGPVQIRNSNSVSLAAQAKLSGAEPVPLGNAPDNKAELRTMIERGLQEDILVLSGGVSVGKYDFVEAVLHDLGAEFFFDAIAIRPGKPAVFGICRGKFVFGLPGNPVSTMVTFELLAVPAIDIMWRPGTKGASIVEGQAGQASGAERQEDAFPACAGTLGTRRASRGRIVLARLGRRGGACERELFSSGPRGNKAEICRGRMDERAAAPG